MVDGRKQGILLEMQRHNGMISSKKCLYQNRTPHPQELNSTKPGLRCSQGTHSTANPDVDVNRITYRALIFDPVGHDGMSVAIGLPSRRAALSQSLDAD
jgi:hypothetical protein